MFLYYNYQDFFHFWSHRIIDIWEHFVEIFGILQTLETITVIHTISFTASICPKTPNQKSEDSINKLGPKRCFYFLFLFYFLLGFLCCPVTASLKTKDLSVQRFFHCGGSSKNISSSLASESFLSDLLEHVFSFISSA